MKVSFAVLASAILIALSIPAWAQSDTTIERLTTKKMDTFELGSIAWKDEPLLPHGAKSALLIGDPSKPGVFMAYLKFPANYEIPAHTHPFAEVVTVLKGTVWNGMGEKLDREKGKKLDVGTSFTLPAGHAHYLWNQDETVVLLTATGPWNIKYINPDDDPRKQWIVVGTHVLRQVNAVADWWTGNLWAVQPRYLGIQVDDTIEIAQKIDI